MLYTGLFEALEMISHIVFYVFCVKCLRAFMLNCHLNKHSIGNSYCSSLYRVIKTCTSLESKAALDKCNSIILFITRLKK